MNRIYTFKVDSELDKRLNRFQKQLAEGERIVEQTTVKCDDGTSKLIITTEQESKGRNLLFDQIRRGEMTNPLGKHGEKILKG